MRILKALVSFLIILSIVGLVGVLITREVLLAKALYQMQGDFGTTKKKALRGEYSNDCLRQSGTASTGVTQIRFFDSESYGIEVVCDNLASNPILTQKRDLPALVHKVYGDSGLIDNGENQGEIEVVVLGRHGTLYQNETGEITWRYGTITPGHSLSGPAASCAGYGLTCCNDALEQGSGQTIQGAVDCPQSCFAQCWERPVVLALNTEPYYDITTRKVEIKAGQEVEFSFVISESQKDVFADTKISDQSSFGSVILALTEQFLNRTPVTNTAVKEVVIDFGDGSAQKLTESQGLVSHGYECRQAKCSYTAVVSATNVEGAESRKTPINTVIVEVTP